MRSRFKRIVLLGMIVLVVLVPTVSAAESPAPGQPAGQDVRIQPEAAGVTVELTLPDYSIKDVVRDGVAYQQIVIDSEGWAQAGQPGAPQLPERGVMLAVPPTGDVSLQVLEATPVTADGSHLLQPAPRASVSGDQLVEQWQADPAEYAQSAWTPAAQAEIVQEGWLRGYRFVRVALRPFQTNPASGELRVASTLRVRLAFSKPGPAVPALPADPIYAPVFWSAFANYDQAMAWQTRPQSSEDAQRQITTASQVRVTVNADGLYRVTYDALVDAGVPATVNPRTFRLLDAGVEQSIYVFGEDNGFQDGDYVLFYGLRNKAALSDDNNVYWLTWGGADGLRMAQPNVAPGSASLANVVLTTQHAEQNISYKGQRPFVDWRQPVRYDSWYWNVEVNNDPVPFIASKTITMTDVMVDPASTVAPVLSMWMAGNWDDPNSYKAVFQLGNASPVDRTWTNTRVLTGTVTFPAGTLVNGANQITLTPVNVSGAPHDEYGIWLDWLELTYPYNGVYRSNLVFNNPTAGTWRYRVTNSPSATPWVLDIGTPSQPKLLTGFSATPTGGTHTLTWQQATTAANRFLVMPDAEVRQPAAVEPYVDAGLLNTNQQVDYLVISHGSLIASVQPLAAMHAAGGLSVKIVDVRDIYDAFSDGSVSADAIHDYLAFVYTHYPWPAPTYVLLVGDGTVDFRGYKFASYGHANLIPPFMGGFDAWAGASLSDSAYALLHGNDSLGEMIISRLPVNYPSEAQTVVNKTVNYASTFPADRAHSTLWIADRPDNDNPRFGTQFHMASDETIAELAPGISATRVYYCNPTINSCPAESWIYTSVSNSDPNHPGAREALVREFSQGNLLAYFTGHGSTTVWGKEFIYFSRWISDGGIGQLTNGSALPYLLVSSCNSGYFADPRRNAMDEAMLRAAGGGTVGGYTGATFDLLQPQTELLKEFMRAVMHEGITETGVAATVAKARLYGLLQYPENERTALGHGLSGDPALQLVQPQTCATGDLNCDNAIDIVDVQLVAGAWNATAWSIGYSPRADLERDGRIDINDIIAVAGLWHTR